MGYIPLPEGLVDPRSMAGSVFDQIAADYDRARPAYPRQAMADLQTAAHLTEGSRILEIGCGTGQATRALAAIGCAIRCVEPGPNLAELARQNLVGYPKVEIRTTTFEDAVEPSGSYDAVVAATAFHWVDPNVSYRKAAALLRTGGVLALLTNAHAWGGTQDQIAEQIAEVHRDLASTIGPWTFPTVDALRKRAEAGGDIAAVWARVDRNISEPPSVSDLFEPPIVAVYPWIATYDRAGYQAMLSTQSAYALMIPEQRAAILDAVGDLVDQELGGVVTKQYVCILTVSHARHA